MSENRDKHINFRVTENEYEQIKVMAERAGFSISTFCKKIIAGSKISEPLLTPEEKKVMISEIGHIGGNLNQIAKHFNQGCGNREGLALLNDVNADFEKLIDFISKGKKPRKAKSISQKAESAPPQIENKQTEKEKVCPACGKVMKLRKGTNGNFWGCSGYPNCKHTESVN